SVAIDLLGCRGRCKHCGQTFEVSHQGVRRSASDPPRAADAPANRLSKESGDSLDSRAGPSGFAPDLPEQFGRYRIMRLVGRGGMGSVYLAHDLKLDRQVALKVPHLTPADPPERLERFQREARAAATFDHPGLCPVYDVGQIDGIHFLTMPYIAGKPLAEVIDPDKP